VRRWYQLLLMPMLMLWVGIAGAHPAPFSYLDLYLDESGTRGTLTLHDYDLAHELGITQPDELLKPEVVQRYRAQLTQVMDTRLQLVADLRPVRPVWQDAIVLAERQSVQLQFKLLDDRPGQLDIVAWLFAYDPTHQTFINIYEDGQLKHQAILDARHTSMNYYSGSLQGRWTVVRTYVQAGVHHILIGPDHVLFLFGLLLLGGTLWRLLSIVTAFTIGHSITLSLAALGVMRLPGSLIEPVIALSVVVVGVDNLLVRKQQVPGTGVMQDAVRDLRPWLAATFGLVHGFGFAAVLQEFGLPREALIWSLAAFNIGVEVGQLLIVMLVTGALWGLRRYSAVLAERCVLLGSGVVIAAGGYWFVQRVWFTV
jgi:hydrogenase/urease accessory protein HupE